MLILKTWKELQLQESSDVFFFLVVPRGVQNLSSLTRSWISPPSSESMESLPLDHQGIPSDDF